MSLYSELFGFLDMVGTYEQRVVANTKTSAYEIDTALVTDRVYPYETAVRANGYRDGEWIVLEYANTKEDAQAVHKKWEETLAKSLPSCFYDVYEDRYYAKTN